jgi:hypothetical protein
MAERVGAPKYRRIKSLHLIEITCFDMIEKIKVHALN